jgi:hypothetical protein
VDGEWGFFAALAEVVSGFGIVLVGDSYCAAFVSVRQLDYQFTEYILRFGVAQETLADLASLAKNQFIKLGLNFNIAAKLF